MSDKILAIENGYWVEQDPRSYRQKWNVFRNNGVNHGKIGDRDRDNGNRIVATAKTQAEAWAMAAEIIRRPA
jgi:hypothetical protein